MPRRPSARSLSRRAMLLVIVLAAVLSSVVTFTAMMLISPSVGRAAADPLTGVPLIRAERIELVDSNGRLRAVLEAVPLGDSSGGMVTRFALLGEKGTSDVTMEAYPYGTDLRVSAGDHSITLNAFVDPLGADPRADQVGLNVERRIVNPATGTGITQLRAGIGMGYGPGRPYGVFVYDDNGQLLWQAP